MDIKLSVVVPVYNAEEHLRTCLKALSKSTYKPFEVIVVDDGSTDDSPNVAAEFGAKVLTTGGRLGPAFARNMGAKEATGDILYFVDADVAVHTATLFKIARDFVEDPELDALIGSYDTSPQSKDFLSQYKNLMHCYVHQTARREACTFWSGCGAIRRHVFMAFSGFDEGYDRPAVEDIELGYRLRRGGHKMVLDRSIQVKHMKRWTFWNLVKTDIFDRGIPWTELILRDRSMPNDLNVQISQRVSVALVFLLFAFAMEGAIRYGGYFLTPVLGMLFFLLGRYWVEGASRPKSPLVKALMGALLVLFLWLCYANGMLTMAPPVLLGYVLLFLRKRYGAADDRTERITGKIYAVYFLMTGVFILTFLPISISVMVFYLVLMVVVILNTEFYRFLGAKWGGLCAIAAIPLHLLYHFYNGISFGVGLIRYGWKRLFQPDNELELKSADKQN